MKEGAAPARRRVPSPAMLLGPSRGAKEESACGRPALRKGLGDGRGGCRRQCSKAGACVDRPPPSNAPGGSVTRVTCLPKPSPTSPPLPLPQQGGARPQEQVLPK